MKKEILIILLTLSNYCFAGNPPYATCGQYIICEAGTPGTCKMYQGYVYLFIPDSSMNFMRETTLYLGKVSTHQLKMPTGELKGIAYCEYYADPSNTKNMNYYQFESDYNYHSVFPAYYGGDVWYQDSGGNMSCNPNLYSCYLNAIY